MRNRTTLVIAIVIFLILMVYMCTFQLDFNQVAVVTTFGRATVDDVYDGDEAPGVIGNLILKAPKPIQDVRVYDKRIHLMDTRLEEQQTLDKQGVVLNIFVTWRISDALSFHRSLKTVENAESQIKSLLRDARSVIGQYNFDDLTNPDPEQLKLAEVEQKMFEKVNERLSRQDSAGNTRGVSVESVGVKRILLTQATSAVVFDRMRETRRRLASQAINEGEAISTGIESEAERIRNTILDFARRRAEEIRGEGEIAASRYYEQFQADEDLAIFLRKLEMFEKTLGSNSTLFIGPNGIYKDLRDPAGATPSTSAETRSEAPLANQQPEGQQ